MAHDGEHQLVVRGGTVIDGSGGPRRRADVAVDDGRVTAVGTVAGRGAVELEADGLLVTPGWVDIHTHYDGQVTWDPLLTPSCWHGVTTVVMGNCGVGFAPVRPDRREWLIELMEGVEDIPGTALHEGIRWAWETFPEYLDAIETTPHAVDVAAQIPHGALRGYVMGDRGADHAEAPTPDEIRRMGDLVAEALTAGALGFSTSRTVNHRSSDGRHTPSLTAGRDELLGIAAAMGRAGVGVIEVVADFVDLESEFELLEAMARTSGRPMSITTLQTDARPDQWRELLGLIEAATAAGADVRGQVAARPVGLIMTLDGRVHPFVGSATYRNLAGLPLAERVEALRRPEVRAAIVAESTDGLPFGWAKTFLLGDRPDYDPGADASLAARADAEATTPADLAYDALLAHDGTGALYVPIMNYAAADLADTRAMLAHPRTVPGLGDAGAHCTMICDGSFPTYLVTAWGRDRPDRFELEWIVHQQARATALAVGLADRGLLAPGYKADLNLVDLDALAIGRPEMLHDLPADGKRLVQRAQGYVTTVVDGAVTFHDGAPTGALPGRLVRGARPDPVPSEETR